MNSSERPARYESGFLGYAHTLEKLKTQKRTGWVNQGTKEAESIADHMFRMSMLALGTDDKNLNIPQCVMLSLVHDLAEADVGDITPFNVSGITRDDKLAREEAAMIRITGLLEGTMGAIRIRALWEEYEARETPEAIFVKDLDMFELGVQGVEYERSQGIGGLQSFFETTIPKIKHSQVKLWASELMEERRDLWKQKGWENYIHISVSPSEEPFIPSEVTCSIPTRVFEA